MPFGYRLLRDSARSHKAFHHRRGVGGEDWVARLPHRHWLAVLLRGLLCEQTLAVFEDLCPLTVAGFEVRCALLQQVLLTADGGLDGTSALCDFTLEVGTLTSGFTLELGALASHFAEQFLPLSRECRCGRFDVLPSRVNLLTFLTQKQRFIGSLRMPLFDRQMQLALLVRNDAA